MSAVTPAAAGDLVAGFIFCSKKRRRRQQRCGIIIIYYSLPPPANIELFNYCCNIDEKKLLFNIKARASRAIQHDMSINLCHFTLYNFKLYGVSCIDRFVIIQIWNYMELYDFIDVVIFLDILIQIWFPNFNKFFLYMYTNKKSKLNIFHETLLWKMK